MMDLDALRAEVARRLGPKRLQHVEAVVETAAEIAASAGWPRRLTDAALRASWVHDACKEDDVETWIQTIEEAGWEPDRWARAHAPHLLHAQAAAAWAAGRGESDVEMLTAVRHHPTAHPDWGSVGRVVFVADFCEPTRAHAGVLGTDRLRRRAGEGDEGLAEAARRVLALRLQHLVERERPIHPDSFRAWNAWSLEAER